MARVFRLFISSTFQDWQPEREYLRAYVFPRLHKLCEDHGTRFLPVDLRWGISEEAAKTHETVGICLEEIERCQRLTPRPNFLVLLGDRYGWRPVPPVITKGQWDKLRQLGIIQDQKDKNLWTKWYQLDENSCEPEYVLKAKDDEWEVDEQELRKQLDCLVETDHSFTEDELAFLVGAVTEQEIVRGAMAVSDAQNHVHAFERSFTNEVDNPAFTDHLPGGVKGIPQQRLMHVKERLSDRLGRNYHRLEAQTFNSQWKEGNLPEDYLKSFGEQVFESLRAVIDQELEENSNNQEVIPPALEFYVEREELKSLMADANYPRMLFGEAGTGKSTLLARVANAIKKQGDEVLCFWIGRDERCASGMGLLHAMASDLKQRAWADLPNGITSDELISKSFFELEKILKFMLGQLSSEQQVVIDAIDQLPENDPAKTLGWLPEKAPVLISSLDIMQKKTFEEMAGNQYVIHLSDMDPYASEKLLARWFQSIGRRLQTEQKQAILKEYNGKPLHLRILFERAKYLRSFDSIPEWLGGDSLPTEDAIADFYNYLARDADHGEVMVKRTLAYLVSTPFGVPEDVLLALLRKDSAIDDSFRERASKDSPEVDEMPEVLWSRLYHDLEPFLSRRSFFGEVYLDFYHAQFRRLITEGQEPWVGAEVLNDCRQKIEAWANDWKKAPKSSLQSFLFRHGTDNAIKLGSMFLSEACMRITNFGYLMARVDALSENETNELAREYGLLDPGEKVPDWASWREFIRSNAHLLCCGGDKWPTKRILLQLATDKGGMIAEKAAQWLKEGDCDWLWFRNKLKSNACLNDLKNLQHDFDEVISNVEKADDNHVAVWGAGKNFIGLWDLITDTIMHPATEPMPDHMPPSDSGLINPNKPQTIVDWPLSSGGTLFVTYEIVHQDQYGNHYKSSARIEDTSGEIIGSLPVNHSVRLFMIPVGVDRFISWSDQSRSICLWDLSNDECSSNERLDGKIVSLSNGNIIMLTSKGAYLSSIKEADLKRLKGLPDVKFNGAAESSDGKSIVLWQEKKCYLINKNDQHGSPVVGDFSHDVVGATHIRGSEWFVWYKLPGSNDYQPDEYPLPDDALDQMQVRKIVQYDFGAKTHIDMFDGCADDVIAIGNGRVFVACNHGEEVGLSLYDGSCESNFLQWSSTFYNVHSVMSLSTDQFIGWGSAGLCIYNTTDGEICYSLTKTEEVGALGGEMISIKDIVLLSEPCIFFTLDEYVHNPSVPSEQKFFHYILNTDSKTLSYVGSEPLSLAGFNEKTLIFKKNIKYGVEYSCISRNSEVQPEHLNIRYYSDNIGSSECLDSRLMLHAKGQLVELQLMNGSEKVDAFLPWK